MKVLNLLALQNLFFINSLSPLFHVQIHSTLNAELILFQSLCEADVIPVVDAMFMR